MTIAQAPQAWIKYIVLVGVVAVLAACGGGGGGDKEPPIAPPDTTPTAFTLNVVENAEPGAEVISEAITVGGINAPAPISITGGEYSINSGAYTNAAGTVTNGQRVTVKVTTAEETDTEVSATLTIGGITGTFIVTTLTDTTPPTAQITFPPPVSMKDGESILVRGTASDDYSTITSVTVGGVAAESDDGFATWTALVALAEGDNTIGVVVVDENNTNEAAASVAVRRAASNTAFPDNEVPINYVTGIAFDLENNRALVPNFKYLNGVTAVIAIDLSTGVRTEFSEPGDDLIRPAGIVIDPVANRGQAVMVDEGGSIFGIKLGNGNRNILSDDNLPLDRPVDIALNPDNEDEAYVVDSVLKALQRINLATGDRVLVSDNAMPDSGPELVMPERLLIDSANNRAIVMDIFQPQLFSVDLATGDRSVLFGNGVPEPESDVNCPIDLATDDIQSRIFITDCEHGISMLDLATNTLSNVFGPVTTVGFNKGFLSFPVDAAFALYAERDTQALYAIDLINWDFVILSKSVAE